MDGYLAKPLQTTELDEVLAKLGTAEPDEQRSTV
jgi:hypothetical protein